MAVLSQSRKLYLFFLSIRAAFIAIMSQFKQYSYLHQAVTGYYLNAEKKMKSSHRHPLILCGEFSRKLHLWNVLRNQNLSTLASILHYHRSRKAMKIPYDIQRLPSSKYFPSKRDEQEVLLKQKASTKPLTESSLFISRDFLIPSLFPRFKNK